jgi:hypothetical protein
MLMRTTATLDLELAMLRDLLVLLWLVLTSEVHEKAIQE